MVKLGSSNLSCKKKGKKTTVRRSTIPQISESIRRLLKLFWVSIFLVQHNLTGWRQLWVCEEASRPCSPTLKCETLLNESQWNIYNWYFPVWAKHIFLMNADGTDWSLTFSGEKQNKLKCNIIQWNMALGKIETLCMFTCGMCPPVRSEWSEALSLYFFMGSERQAHIWKLTSRQSKQCFFTAFFNA